MKYDQKRIRELLTVYLSKNKEKFHYILSGRDITPDKVTGFHVLNLTEGDYSGNFNYSADISFDMLYNHKEALSKASCTVLVGHSRDDESNEVIICIKDNKIFIKFHG